MKILTVETALMTEGDERGREREVVTGRAVQGLNALKVWIWVWILGSLKTAAFAAPTDVAMAGKGRELRWMRATDKTLEKMLRFFIRTVTEIFLGGDDEVERPERERECGDVLPSFIRWSSANVRRHVPDTGCPFWLQMKVPGALLSLLNSTSLKFWFSLNFSK